MSEGSMIHPIVAVRPLVDFPSWGPAAESATSSDASKPTGQASATALPPITYQARITESQQDRWLLLTYWEEVVAILLRICDLQDSNT